MPKTSSRKVRNNRGRKLRGAGLWDMFSSNKNQGQPPMMQNQNPMMQNQNPMMQN